MDSAFVEPVEEEGEGLSVTLGYSAPHALIVHERLDLRHAPGTQAKYLETAANEALSGMAERLAATVNRWRRIR
jgi:hypothetical protein